MSTATQPGFAKDSWQTPRNARTLRVFMALRNQEIGARVRELREQRGNPPQTVVAEAIGVAERTYQTWESGEAKPGYRNLQRLAEFFEVSEEFILAGVDATPASSTSDTPDLFPSSDGDVAARLDEVDAKLAELQNALETNRAERETNQGTIRELLEEQSELLDMIRTLVAGLGVPDGLTLQDHLAQLVRDTAVRSAEQHRLPGQS